MRRGTFFFLIAFFVISLPVVAHAASADFFGPIISQECTCPGTQAPGWGCVLETIRVLMNFAIAIACAVATLVVAYAGLLFIGSASNPEMKSKARTVLINAVIGMLIVLSAWLIIDFIMSKLYNPGAFGPWNSLLYSDGRDMCIEAGVTQSLFTGPNVTALPGDTTSPGSTAPPASSGGGGDRCTPIPASQLASFPSGASANGPHTALPDTVQRFMSMRAAAARDGVDLKITSAYRSPSDQVNAWNANGCNVVNGHAVCRVRTAAIPCSLGGHGSNHSLGTAVDIRLNSGAYAWLRAHAANYGFYNALPNDLVHWSSTGR